MGRGGDGWSRQVVPCASVAAVAGEAMASAKQAEGASPEEVAKAAAPIAFAPEAQAVPAWTRKLMKVRIRMSLRRT